MLILKSASPRRQEVFKNLGLKFEILPSQIDESLLPFETPLEYLNRITIAKLEISKVQSPSFIYVSSDTIVVLKDRIFPKPSSMEECFEFLQELSGKEHKVFSSMAIYKNFQLIYDFDETRVKMKNLSLEEIWQYIQTQSPLDKAGGYGIQDENTPVEKFYGSFTNVLGFPIRKFFIYHPIWREFL